MFPGPNGSREEKTFAKQRAVRCVCLGIALAAIAGFGTLQRVRAAESNLAHDKTPASSTKIAPKQIASYGRLPLSFEANQGHADQTVKFFSRGRGCGLFLTGDEAVLT